MSQYIYMYFLALSASKVGSGNTPIAMSTLVLKSQCLNTTLQSKGSRAREIQGFKNKSKRSLEPLVVLESEELLKK